MEVKGLDISKFEAGIDFDDIVAKGYEFVIIRGGYTGSKSSKPQAKDKYFESFYEQAKAHKLGVGCYFFSRATSKEEGIEEAEYLYENCLVEKQFEYPIFIDVEDNVYQAKASKTAVTDAIVGFCEHLEDKGFYVGYYSNPTWMENHLEPNRLAPYDLWLAHWTKKPSQKWEYGIWQCSGTKDGADIEGCEEKVDRNISYINYPRIMKKKGFNGFEPNSIEETIEEAQPLDREEIKQEEVEQPSSRNDVPDTNITWEEGGIGMSEKWYDFLKSMCTVVLPALGACYVAIAKVWDLPYATEIVGTLSAICTLIGALLGINSKQYWEDKEIVNKDALENK